MVLLGAALGMAAAAPASAQFLAAGLDEKLTWDEAGNQVLSAAGKDVLCIIDIGLRTRPQILVSIPLPNTVMAPPSNVAVTPDQRLALITNSMEWGQDETNPKPEPDNKLFLVDLKASPVALTSTIEVGSQPAGVAVNRVGDLALITNSGENSLSVIAIKGAVGTLLGKVRVSAADAPNARVNTVAIGPAGKLALVTKSAEHKIAVIDIDGQQVSYSGTDIPVGLWPSAVQIAPSGKFALVANGGIAAGSDGNIDTVTVVDLETKPPRVIDHFPIGDGPSSLAISPTGPLAVVVLSNGSGSAPKSAPYRHEKATLAILKIDGKKVAKAGEIDLGAYARSAAFSPDGRYLYVANYLDRDLAIFKVEGTKLMKVGSNFKLPGRPASLRGSAP